MADNDLLQMMQAAAGFTSTAANIVDNIQKEKARTEVNAAGLEMNQQFNDYLNGLNNRNDFQNFSKDWNSRKVQIFNSASKGLSTQYARDIAWQMFQESDLQQSQKIQVEQFRREADFTLTGIQNNVNGRNNDISLTWDQRLQLNQADWQSAYNSGLIDYSVYNQKITQTGTDVAYAKLYEGAKQVLDEKGLLAATEYINSNTDRTTLLNGAEVPMAPLKEKAAAQITDDDRMIKALRKQEQQERWDNSFNETSLIASNYYAKGDKSFITKAITHIQSMKPDDMDPTKRDQLLKEYRRILDDTDGGAQDQLRRTLENLATQEIGMMVEKVSRGEISATDGGRGVIDSIITQFKKNTGKTLSADEVHGFVNVNKKYFDAIKNHSSFEGKKTYIESIEKQVEPIIRMIYDTNKPLTDEQKDMANKLHIYLAKFAWDLTYDNTTASLSDSQLQKRVGDVIKETIGKKLTIMQEPITDGVFNSAEKQAAQKQGILQNNGDLVFIDNYGRTVWAPGMEDAIADLNNPQSLWSMQRNDLAKTLGLSAEDVNQITVSLSPDENRGNDATGTAIFIYRKDGSRYRYQTDEKGNMILQMAAKGETNWTTTKRLSEQQRDTLLAIQKEQGAQAAARQQAQKADMDAQAERIFRSGVGSGNSIEEQAARKTTRMPDGFDVNKWRRMNEEQKTAVWVEYLKKQENGK